MCFVIFSAHRGACEDNKQMNRPFDKDATEILSHSISIMAK